MGAGLRSLKAAASLLPLDWSSPSRPVPPPPSASAPRSDQERSKSCAHVQPKHVFMRNAKNARLCLPFDKIASRHMKREEDCSFVCPVFDSWLSHHVSQSPLLHPSVWRDIHHLAARSRLWKDSWEVDTDGRQEGWHTDQETWHWGTLSACRGADRVNNS